MVIHIFLVILIALIVLMCVTAIIYLYYKRSLVQKALDDAWSRMSVQSLEAEHRTQLTLRISSIVGSNQGFGHRFPIAIGPVDPASASDTPAALVARLQPPTYWSEASRSNPLS